MKEAITEALRLTIAVSPEDRLLALQLIAGNDLPVSDLDDEKLLYLLRADDRIIGTGGMEIFDDCALLRSVSVIKSEQGKGYGRYITGELENFASESGIRCFYLLTTTAEDFFAKLGYCTTSRDKIPESVRSSSEFSTVCPSDATVMTKRL